jgi:hypothetical protein
MSPTKVLIAVKTYPTLSTKYDELVCTAGFREDGSWVRLYPIPFRKLDYRKRYRKWQWIAVNLEKNTSDFRPETYRPIGDISTVGEVGTSNNWAERKKFALKKVHTNMEELIAEAKDKQRCTSLATLKPQNVVDFVWEEVEREWDKEKLAAVYASMKQFDLFEPVHKLFQVVKKLPYEFSYKFTTEDGKERKLMIEDWELGQLFWNCLKKYEGDEVRACQDVKFRYFDEFMGKKNLYFFLGTTKEFHYVSPNPFIIIGAFYPQKEIPDGQGRLFP